MQWRWLSVGLLVIACGPRAAEPSFDDAGSSSTGGVETPDTVSHGEDAASSSEATTTISTTTSSSADSASSSEDSTTAEIVCLPPADPATISVFPTVPLVGPVTCRIAAVDPHDDGVNLSLACPLDNPSPPVDGIGIGTHPRVVLPLAQDDLVIVHFVSGSDDFGSQYLRIDKPDFGHVLTFIDGEALRPSADFPLPVDTLEPLGTCLHEPTECGDEHRVSLHVRARPEGKSVELFDGEHATLPDAPNMEVWVDRATEIIDPQCIGGLFRWFRLLIVTTSE